MNHSLVKNIVKYGISFGVCLIMAAVYVFARIEPAELGNTAPVDLYRTLCDAFTIPGTVSLMMGCLMSLSNQGALDGVGFLVSYAVKKLIPGKGGDLERYADYIERKRENRAKGYGFLYVTGIVCLALAGVFMMLFYSIFKK